MKETYKRWVEKNQKKNSEYKKRHYQDNLEHNKELRKRWRENNPERKKELQKRYVANNIEKVREAGRLRAEKKRDAFTPKQQAQYNKANRDWRKNNPEAARIHLITSTAKRQNSPGYKFIPKTFIEETRKAQKNKCYWCKKKLTKYHVDHVIPVSKGGDSHPSNLVISCPSCNLKKSNKLLHKFSGRLL